MTGRGARIAVLFVTWVLAACGAEDQRTDTVTGESFRQAAARMGPEVQAQLDSGNAAIREEDPETALRHYRRAVEIDDGVAAAWFGVYMAELARGNGEAAAEALERARRAAPGASLIEPDSTGVVPPTS
jgi:tetratricopeptide (TPR) repeat protein